MTPLRDATFLITDVETTGRSAAQNRITEVGCVWVADGEIVDERSTLVNAGQFVPREIQELTGITNAMLIDAPKADQIFPDIRRWFGADTIFTAHNAKFDFNFLQQSFNRHGLQGLDPTTLCTLRLSRRLLPSHRGFSLGRLAAYFGVRVRNRHRALGDAYATAKILITLLEMAEEDHGCETVEELLRLQYRPTAAFRSTPAKASPVVPTVRELPSVPGVYRMLGRGDELLYVGKAKNLRDRVGSYFRPGADHTPKVRELVRRIKRVEIEETGSELGALLLESRLIKEYKPKYNTAGKRLRRYGFIRLDIHDPFPRVEFSAEILPDGAEYYGPFRNRDAVNMLLETIDRVFRLRECKEAIEPNEETVPCFYHQIHRCTAPCACRQTMMEYRDEVERVRNALSGSEEGIIGMLTRKMEEHAVNLEFEAAAELRDRVAELRRVFVWKRRVAESVNTNNMLILLPSPAQDARELFLVRFGRLARQAVVGKRFPEKTLRRHVEAVYFGGETVPPKFDRIEIDEIRIIAGYLRRRGDEGTVIHVRSNDTVETVMDRLREAATG